MINYDFYHIENMFFIVENMMKKNYWNTEIYTAIFMKVILKIWKSIEKTV